MKIIDLTHPLQNDMIRFDAPWHVTTEIRQLGTIESVGRNTSVITVGSHAGTHMDTARHFIADGESIDQISLEKTVGSVTIIDFSHKKKNCCVTRDDLDGLLISKRMLFYFGWDQYWNTDQFYKEYPWFSEEAAQYLINKGVNLIGMDTPSPDNSTIVLNSNEDSKIHKLFLRQGVTLIEYLANLGQVDTLQQWNLCALPLLVKDCDGAPIRACLISDDSGKTVAMEV